MVRFAMAIAAGLLLASGGAQAACTTSKAAKRHKPHTTAGCVINFNAVPEISKKIVAEEQRGQPAPRPVFVEPQAAPYTGPTIGLNHMVRRAPEIGYKWSIN
jgi:hypothetical protein